MAAVMVLVHGMVISSRYMVPTAERLAPFCRVLASDLPGYGQSFKPWPILSVPALADTLAAWLDRLGIPLAHWVANSFGCQVSAEVAVRHSERVDRMVLQGPTVDPAARTLPQQLWRSLLNSPHEAKGLGKITRQDYRAAGLRRAWATLKLVLSDHVEDKLPRIEAPVLVVRGENDPTVPQPWAEAVTRQLPHGKLRVIPGAGHALNYSAPVPLVAVIRPFLGV